MSKLNSAKNRTLLAVFLSGLLCCALSGCGNKLERGEIIAKRYEPDSEYVMLIPIMISCGKNCFSTIMIPYVVYDDEDYIVTVRGKDEDGKVRVEEWYVTKEAYNKATVGRVETALTLDATTDDEHEKLREAT